MTTEIGAMRDECELKRAALKGQTKLSKEFKADVEKLSGQLDEAVRLLEELSTLCCSSNTGCDHCQPSKVFLARVKGGKE